MSNGFYQDPAVFDILHAPGTAHEVDGLERIARLFSVRHGPGSTWFEPACGTGRYLSLAARRGYRVTGIDLSPTMVKFATDRVPRKSGRILVGDMTRIPASLGKADFAFCLINTLRHLPSDAAFIRHLQSVKQRLARGGAYAVGLSTTAYGLESPSEDVWQGRRGGCHVKQIAEYFPPTNPSNRFEQVYSHLVITRGSQEEHRDHAYRLRCYSTAQWRRVVAAARMEIAAIIDDRGNPHDPGQFGYALYILKPRTTRSRATASRATASRGPGRRR